MTKKEIKNWQNIVKTMGSVEKQIIFVFFKAYQTFEMLNNIQDVFGIYNEQEYNKAINDWNIAINEYAKIKNTTHQIASDYLFGFANGTIKIK